MSNLGMYQWIVIASKKLKGPQNLLILTGIVSAAVYKLGEVGIKKAVRVISKVSSISKDGVTSSCKSDMELELEAGDQFKVLGIDGNSVLIEKLGDKNNPYFMSKEFLHTASDYEKSEKTTSVKT